MKLRLMASYPAIHWLKREREFIYQKGAKKEELG
jgi:hypothetical protein